MPGTGMALEVHAGGRDKVQLQYLKLRIYQLLLPFRKFYLVFFLISNKIFTQKVRDMNVFQ